MHTYIDSFSFTSNPTPLNILVVCIALIILFHYIALSISQITLSSSSSPAIPSPSVMGAPRALRGKVPLSIIAIIILAFAALLYTERTGSLTSSAIFMSKTCLRRNADERNMEINGLNYASDDQFDPDECSVNHGKWVFNSSIKPLYTDRTCRFLDRQVRCVKNGRLDSDYRHWEWQPDGCRLPRFDPEIMLRKLKGKRLMFVGDSLQRGQWQSFVCLVDSVIPKGKKSMTRGRMHTVFKAKEYDATIEFYWAPFLIESNTDVHILADPKQRIVKVDSIAQHAKHWTGVDILVFNTYVWWMSGLKTKTLWGSFANGEEGYEELETHVSYTLGLKTWANWVDSNVNPKKTQVFFTTMSPSHHNPADWGNENGTKCFNETKPITNKRHWGSGSDKRMMSVVASVVRRMKVPVTLINITQLSEYRIDGHTSIYTELGGKLLTEEQKADPMHFADCIHWCLPGIPDTWNQILYAHLLL